MKNKTMLKIILLSLALSSCGLIEKFKSPEEPTDAASSTSENVVDNGADASVDVTDDLFSKTLEETSDTAGTGTDAPSNVTAQSSDDAELKSLEDEFSPSGSGTAPQESSIAVAPTQTDSTVKQESPMLVEEALPEIKTEVAPVIYSETGAIKKYQVQRGETLMQIAFKLYGNISQWKELKAMNADKIMNNSSLKSNTTLNYRAPKSPFIWNPQGAPHLIKSGETLGTISNTVYSTPKKWKTIWENNRPLIKNPNVIYAGFTLYYTTGGMANYVQPKAEQPKKEILARELARDAEIRLNQAKDTAIEEVLVDKFANEKIAPRSAPTTTITTEEEEQVDEAIQTISATKRQAVKNAVERVNAQPADEKVIDLVNNVTAPNEPEIAPDIDEEIQTLE